MKLTRSNIEEWKRELDEKMKRQFNTPKYLGMLDDEYWLTYEGMTVDEVIAEETSYWDEDRGDDYYKKNHITSVSGVGIQKP